MFAFTRHLVHQLRPIDFRQRTEFAIHTGTSSGPVDFLFGNAFMTVNTSLDRSEDICLPDFMRKRTYGYVYKIDVIIVIVDIAFVDEIVILIQTYI
nr:unnamed protein product [Callosobruchus chinensis]